MRRKIFIAAVCGCIVLSVVFVVLCFKREAQNSERLYRINYTSGRWTFSDYTDTYTLKENKIEYIDQNNQKIIRCGSFSVYQQH